jgi:NADH-ubiquinone oxidoreductase chain 3
MTSTTFFIIFIPILSILLLSINLLLAPHNPYQEKDSVFECGFHSFLGQNRTQFSVSFFIFAILFLLFDLEIVLIYPYSVSGYSNDIYGLVIMMVFFGLLTLGFIFELGKNALTIDSRQTSSYNKVETPISHSYLTSSLSSLSFLSLKDKCAKGLELALSNPPKPHAFTSLALQSDMGISEIVTEINGLLPQLSKFISQFTTTVSKTGINVLTDSTGSMSIDVPQNLSEAAANNISTKIGIIDRLITTRGQEINDLLQQGLSLENKLKAENSEYVSQLTDEIKEFKRLNALYKH